MAEPVELRNNFRWMALWFSVCHGCVTTPVLVATSVLDRNTGLVGNGMFYIVTVCASLVLSVPATRKLGLKGTMLAGMSLYTVYLVLFSMSALAAGQTKPSPSGLSTWVFYLGSVCGGLGAGLLWTAQGGFFGRAASLAASAAGIPTEQASGQLAGDFAQCFLLFEFLCKLAFSLFQETRMEVWFVSAIYAAISAVTLTMMTQLTDLVLEDDTSTACGKVAATVRLWTSPLIWFLSPTNIAFGFSSAYINGVLNADVAGPELGAKTLGFLGALTVVCAAFLVQAFAWLATRCGKGLVLSLGAVSFGCIPLLALYHRCCLGFGWVVFVFYILQGSGRAVYESTSKSVFSDFFKGRDTEGAFANCFVQSSLASALCFLLTDKLTSTSLAIMVLCASAITPLMYALAVVTQARLASEGDHEPLLKRGI